MRNDAPLDLKHLKLARDHTLLWEPVSPDLPYFKLVPYGENDHNHPSYDCSTLAPLSEFQAAPFEDRVRLLFCKLMRLHLDYGDEPRFSTKALHDTLSPLAEYCYGIGLGWEGNDREFVAAVARWKANR